MNELELQIARAKTLRRISVMQAWLDGKMIEYNPESDSDPRWIVMDTPEFDWISVDYRIAQPKPREWWLVSFRDPPNNPLSIYATRGEAEACAGVFGHPMNPCCIIHVREVTQEGE